MPLSLLDSRTSRVVFTLLLFALALGFLYAARRTLILFLFAIFFAYLINPAVARLDKFVRGRTRAIALIYLLLLVAVGLFFMLAGPRITRQGARLGQSLPSLVDKASSGQLSGSLGDLAARFSAEHGWSAATQARIQGFLYDHREDLSHLAQRIGVRAAEAAQEIWVLFLVPILAIFFLRDGDSFHGVLVSLVQSRTQREFLENVLHDLNEMLAQFIRAQLTLAVFSFVVYSSFLGIMRFPYALMLGTAGGALEFVPVVGPLVAGVAMVIVAVLSNYHPLLLLAFLLVWRLIQDYVIAPRIMGKSVELHPLAALFGVLAGGEIAGVLGVYLSIPVMASLRIVWRRWRLYAEKRKFGPLNEFLPHEITHERR
ncbi:MAG TPA: AI-2E family transporter [Terriglobales bacterium]|nr:AI-2E family transporter [Terriglobales bacterium]